MQRNYDLERQERWHREQWRREEWRREHWRDERGERRAWRHGHDDD